MSELTITTGFHEADWDSVPVADSIVIGACDCPDIHLVMFDALCRPLLRIVLTPEQFAAEAAHVTAHVAEVRARQGDTIGDVAGRG